MSIDLQYGVSQRTERCGWHGTMPLAADRCPGLAQRMAWPDLARANLLLPSLPSLRMSGILANRGLDTQLWILPGWLRRDCFLRWQRPFNYELSAYSRTLKSEAVVAAAIPNGITASLTAPPH